MSTHYEVLGVPSTATADEIEDQYRNLVKIVHPDMGGDAVTFQVLQESYDVIDDPVRRAAYDHELALQRDVGSGGTRRATPTQSSGGWLRNSTPAQRRQAAQWARSGRQSWHQTPGEYVATGCQEVILRLGLIFAAAIVYGFVSWLWPLLR